MGVQSSRGSAQPAWRRRTILRGAAASLAGLVLPHPARSQAAAPDAFQIIRARAGAAGPALRVTRGEDLRVRLVNDSDEPTALHWHGVRVANAMDGVPGLTQTAVAPGASFDYRFTPPDAGTFWYHPAVTAAGQRLRGPAGALIVADSAPVAADRDELLWVDRLPASADAPRAIAVRTNDRLRLRIVNAQPDAMLALRIDRHRATVMAIDGQPAEPFAARDARVVLGPGNRIDLFVDMTLAPGTSAAILASQGEREVSLARLDYDGGAPSRPAPLPGPGALPVNALPERMDLRNALRLDLPLGAGLPPAGSKPMLSAKRGRTVSLGLVNRGPAPGIVHLHGHHVRLLDALDDGWKPFWLDTITVPGQQTARVAFVADNPGRWLIETALLGLPDSTRVAWFEVA